PNLYTIYTLLIAHNTLFQLFLFINYYYFFFFLMILRPPTSTLFPYTTLFRSCLKTSFNCRYLASCRFWHAICLGRRVQSHAKTRSEEHTSELQSRGHLVCRLLLEKKKALSGLPVPDSGRVPERHLD